MKSFKRNIFAAAIILGAYLLPIFSFMKPYKDDYARIIDGYYEWDRDGRPLANIIMKILNLNGYIGEMAVFNRIFAFTLFVITCAYIGSRLIKRSPFENSLASSLIITSPFFLQNLSYGFDVLTMAISFAVCLIAISSYANRNTLSSFALTFVATFISLNIYQATLPFVFTLIFIELIKKEPTKNDIINCLCKLTASVSALGIYKLYISKFIESFYAKNHSQAINPFESGALDNLISNMHGLLDMIALVVNTAWIVAFSPLIIIFLISIVQFFRSRHGVGYYLTITLSFIAVISSFLIFFLLKSPVYSPRAFIGFGCISCMIAAFTVIKNRLKCYVNIFALSLPFIFYSLIMSSFVSSEKSQYKYDLLLTKEIYNSIPAAERFKEIVFVGGSPKTKTFWVAAHKYPIINHLFSPDLGWWNTRQFVAYEFPFMNMINSSINAKSHFNCDYVVSPYNGQFTILKKSEKNYVFMSKKDCE